MTIAHIEQQAARLLADVKRIQADAADGKTLDADLLRQMRVTADGIKTATYQLQTKR